KVTVLLAPGCTAERTPRDLAEPPEGHDFAGSRPHRQTHAAPPRRASRRSRFYSLNLPQANARRALVTPASRVSRAGVPESAGAGNLAAPLNAEFNMLS